MSSAKIRALLFVPIPILLLALTACGSTPKTSCSLVPSTCGCGPSTVSSRVACPANRFLFAAGFDGQLTTFPINLGTGSVTISNSIPGPQNSFGMTGLGYLYVSNPQIGGISSIDAWAVDIGTGTLTAVPGSPFQLGPLSIAFGLAANSRSEVVYVADAGKIDTLQIGATGALSPIAGSPFPAGNNMFLAIDPMDRFLFTSDVTAPGNVVALAIDSGTGALTPVPGSPFQIAPNSSTFVEPAEIAVDGQGLFVYVALAGTNQIAGFQIDQSSGALTAVPGSPFSTGNGTMTLATVNEFLYVPNGIDGTLSAYSINTTNGVLTSISGSPFPFYAVSLAPDPIGSFMYASGSNGLLALSIDPTSGALTEIGTPVPYAGAIAMTVVP